jgi:transcriptional regulator with XRE-family HTH domain
MQEDVIIQISQRLKELRTANKTTLQELADRAGVSKGLLSQIENSRTIPSLPVLINVIRSLGLDLNSFFDSIDFQKKASGVILRKASEYQPFEKENANGFLYKRIMATSLRESHADFVLLKLKKGAKRGAVKTNAFEFKYLIEGSIEYTIGRKKYQMEAGDSLFFDARQPHHPSNTGKIDALLLVAYFFNEIN